MRFPRRQSPRRFRDRLLAAMLVVALVPLVSFAALVIADLGAMSRSTVDETHQTMLADQRDQQMSQVADRAKLIDARLTALASEVQQLRDQLSVKLQAAAPAGPGPGNAFPVYRGVFYQTAPDTSSTVLTGPTDRAPGASPGTRTATIGGAGAQLLPLMQGIRRSYPEVEAVWLADDANDAVMTVPGFDVPGAINSGRLNPSAPLGPTGDTTFSTSQKQFTATVADNGAWAKPDAATRTGSGPYWTDPYQTRQAGDAGVTVWMPLGDGHTVVGADVAIAPIAQSVLTSTISGKSNAYPLLLSSTNRLLAGGPGVEADFGMASSSPGATLPPSADQAFATGLATVEKTGRATVLPTRLGGVDKLLFTAPIYAAHWVLATTVPLADLEPDVSALTRGIDSGIHRLLLEAIPVAILLCALAFLLARMFARRLVGPVNALTTAAELLADGHTDEAVPPQGGDEVGVLAASLEHMRREINSSRDAILGAARELELRVEDRTGELRARNEELVALNDLAGSLTQSLDEEVILTEALAAVRAVLPMREGRGFSGDGAGLHLVACDSTGTTTTRRRDADDLARIAAAAAEENRMIRHDGANASLIGLPLGTRGGILGALALRVDDAPALARAEPLLRAIADQVGLALRTARLSAEGRATAVLEERTRLAREIHDTLAQQLTAIVLQLEAADVLVGDTGTAVRGREAVVLARDLARSALHEARRSVWDLRPTPLTSTGVSAALAAEVGQWSRRTGIAAHIHAEGVPRVLNLQPRVEVALLRITQEALTNVVKHSGATEVTVRLQATQSELVLTLTDNGRGFDATHDARRADAFGLIGMGERARLAGGDVSVDSVPGGGCQVTVSVPLAEAVAQSVADRASLARS